MSETVIGVLVVLVVLAVLVLGRDRIHAFLTDRGIKPGVGDTFIAATALIAYQLISEGTLDVEGARLAFGLFILGAINVAAPPASGLVMKRGGVEKPY